MNTPNCAARRYSDQMHCGRCGLQWDVNEDDPPACIDAGRATLDRMKVEYCELESNGCQRRTPGQTASGTLDGGASTKTDN